MNSLINQSPEVYASFARESNSRILKASNEARLLRSLSVDSKEASPSRVESGKGKLSLASIIESLFLAVKRSPV